MAGSHGRERERGGSKKESFQASLMTRIFGRPKQGGGDKDGESARRRRPRRLGDGRKASFLFTCVHPDGVQLRTAPRMDARMFQRKWWDTEDEAAGPENGDLIYISSVVGNWAQVAGTCLFLPIKSEVGEQLLQLVHIAGAYKDVTQDWSPMASASGKRGGGDHGARAMGNDNPGTTVGGWNPLLSARVATLSADRLSVFFPPGKTAVAIAEAGFDAGQHVTVVTVLTAGIGYIGMSELPNTQLVNSSHLGLFGFAIGGAMHIRKGKQQQTPKLPAWSQASPTVSPLLPDMSTRKAEVVQSAEPEMLRVWLKGRLGPFVEPFREGDEVALLLDMSSRTLDYFLNKRFVQRISSRLPPGPLYPAVGAHQLAQRGTCFAAVFNVAFELCDGGRTLAYNF